MSETAQELQGAALLEVELALIAFDPDQPRTSADEAALDQLVKSIRTHGLEQPVILTLQPDREIAVHKPYLLLHGSRRCTAAVRAGLSHVPAVLRREDLSTAARIMKQLAENDEREDLNVYDRALAVARAFQTAGLNQAEFARRYGKSRPWLSSQLWLAQVDGWTATALSERLVRHGETARLFSQLPPRTQQRLVETARASGEPITLALVKRAQPRPKPEEPTEVAEPVAEAADGAAAPSSGSSAGPADPVSPDLLAPGSLPSGRVPLLVRADLLPPLLRHFRIHPGGGLALPSDGAVLLAAHLESLVEPPSADHDPT